MSFLDDMDPGRADEIMGRGRSNPTRSCPLLDGPPTSTKQVKVSADMNNSTHGPHADVLTSIPGGTDQARVSPDGDVMGGTTNIGGAQMDW